MTKLGLAAARFLATHAPQDTPLERARQFRELAARWLARAERTDNRKYRTLCLKHERGARDLMRLYEQMAQGEVQDSKEG